MEPASDLILARRLRCLMNRALPGRSLVSWELQPAALTNEVYRIQVDGLNDSFALRIYSARPSPCRKEIALHCLLADRVPVPEILHAEDGENGQESFTLMRWIDGVTLQIFERKCSEQEMIEAAFAVGFALGRLGTTRPEDDIEGLATGPVFLQEAKTIAEFLDRYERSVTSANRLGAEVHCHVGRVLRKWQPRIEPLLAQRSLVHSDFGARNVLVSQTNGRWQIAAVLDWESSYLGSPLWDIGRFLGRKRRFSSACELSFPQGVCEGGGLLPTDWVELSRALELLAMSAALTRADLRPAFVPELAAMIETQIESLAVAAIST